MKNLVYEINLFSERKLMENSLFSESKLQLFSHTSTFCTSDALIVRNPCFRDSVSSTLSKVFSANSRSSPTTVRSHKTNPVASGLYNSLLLFTTLIRTVPSLLVLASTNAILISQVSWWTKVRVDSLRIIPLSASH